MLLKYFCLFASLGFFSFVFSSEEEQFSSLHQLPKNVISHDSKRIQSIQQQKLRRLLRNKYKQVDFRQKLPDFDEMRYNITLSMNAFYRLSKKGTITAAAITDLLCLTDISYFTHAEEAGRNVHDMFGLNPFYYDKEGKVNTDTLRLTKKTFLKGASSNAIFTVETREPAIGKQNPFHLSLIIKEVDIKSNPEEIENLLRHFNSPFSRLPTKDSFGVDLPTISLPYFFFSYCDKKDKRHWVEVLHAAKGKSFREILSEQMASIVDSCTKTKEIEMSTTIMKQFGCSLAAFHRYGLNIHRIAAIVKQRSLCTFDIQSCTHNDLTAINVCAYRENSIKEAIPKFRFTLIDNERMAWSLPATKWPYGYPLLHDFQYFIEVNFFRHALGLKIDTPEKKEFFAKTFHAFISSYFQELEKSDEQQKPDTLYTSQMMRIVSTTLRETFWNQITKHYNLYCYKEDFVDLFKVEPRQHLIHFDKVVETLKLFLATRYSG